MENNTTVLKVVENADLSQSFGNLLLQSYSNMTKLNAQLDLMQKYLEKEFLGAEVDEQTQIYKSLVMRSKQEASLYLSILGLASKHEQIKSLITALLNTNKELSTAKKLSPELKAITDELKKNLKATLENEDE